MFLLSALKVPTTTSALTSNNQTHPVCEAQPETHPPRKIFLIKNVVLTFISDVNFHRFYQKYLFIISTCIFSFMQ